MDRKIRVLHTEWSNGWGGQEIRIVTEMEALREKGVELFLATRERAKIKDKAREKGFEVFTLPFRGSFDLKTFLGLKKIIKDNKIDIVNTHSGKDTWVGGLAAKSSGVKFIRTRHLSNPINPSRLNFINEMADFIFTTGTGIKEAMIRDNRIDPGKIESIPTGVNENIFDPSKYNRNECRKRFGIKDDEIAIGILAVLRSFKRHDIFLDIAKKIRDKYSDKKIKFLIAGEGPKRKSIEQQIKNLNLEKNVVMIGYTKDTPEFLKAIDIFLFTSDKNEGVPQSLIQALMMEVDTVSTNIGSIKDLYKNKNFLISDPNIDQLLKNITQLIENTLSLKKDRSFIMKNFGQDAIASKILNIYSGLLS